MHKNKSFRRTLLLGFVLSTLLPLVFLGGIAYFYLSYKIDEFGNQRTVLLAETVATEISSYLRNPLTVLRQAKIFIDAGILDDDELDDLLVSVVTESDYLESLYVIDRSRTIVNIGLDAEFSDLLDNYIGLDLSGMEMLRNVEYLQGPYWSNSFLSPVSGRKSIALVSPAANGRHIVGLINIEHLHSSISDRSGRRDTSIIVLDDNGVPVFHPQLKIVEEQQSYANLQPYREAQLGLFGTYEFAINGIDYQGSTANIAETKWLVIVIQPIEVAKASLLKITRFSIGAAIVAVVIVLSLAVRQSRRLMRPLEKLQEKIQAVAEGDYKADIGLQQHKEFEEVATLFRDMAQAIEKREQLLELNEERLVSLLEVHNLKELTENELLDFALAQAVNLTRSEIGYMHLLSTDEKSINMTIWSENTAAFCSRYGFSQQVLDEFGFGRKSMEQRRLIIKNTQQNDKVGGGEKVALTVLRELSVPIFDGSSMVAVVGVINKAHVYDRTDARQLSLYFNHTWDILQQKRYEKDRERMAEQLAQAQKLEAIGTLASGIAHDFNNVLMVILGNAELARENIDQPEKVQRDIEQIHKGALRARDLVNQILAFSRSRTEGVRPLDIRPIVKEAIKLLRSSLPANIEVKQNIAKDSHPVYSEPGQINQLIMNLCTNAYQAMEGGGGLLQVGLKPVVLKSDLRDKGKRLVEAGEYMLLTVVDDGRGIPEQMLNRIFEPYYTTREKERGTGLGLAVVHGIVKSLKGGIIVESEPGEGTVFKVYLPVVKKETQSVEQLVTGSLPGGSERILYVDDDPSVADVNSKILRGLGYNVTTFCSSTEGYNHFSDHQDDYDLVITDMSMPEMTGDVLAERILTLRADIPVILCTGYSEEANERRAAEVGIEEVMMKPITRLDLALTVRKVLGFNR